MTPTEKLLAACEALSSGEWDSAVNNCGDYQRGLHCGVEDRSIHDRYQAADYGFERGVERAAEHVSNELAEAIAAVRAEREERATSVVSRRFTCGQKLGGGMRVTGCIISSRPSPNDDVSVTMSAETLTKILDSLGITPETPQ